LLVCSAMTLPIWIPRRLTFAEHVHAFKAG
jgi:hypothetical protein